MDLPEIQLSARQYQDLCAGPNDFVHPIHVVGGPTDKVMLIRESHLPIVPTRFSIPEANWDVDIENRDEETLPFTGSRIAVLNCRNLRQFNHPNKYSGVNNLAILGCPKFDYREVPSLEELHTTHPPRKQEPLHCKHAVIEIYRFTVMWDSVLTAQTYTFNIHSSSFLYRLRAAVENGAREADWQYLKLLDAIWRTTPEEVLERFDPKLTLKAVRDIESVLPRKKKSKAIELVQRIVRRGIEKTR